MQHRTGNSTLTPPRSVNSIRTTCSNSDSMTSPCVSVSGSVSSSPRPHSKLNASATPFTPQTHHTPVPSVFPPAKTQPVDAASTVPVAAITVSDNTDKVAEVPRAGAASHTPPRNHHHDKKTHTDTSLITLDQTEREHLLRVPPSPSESTTIPSTTPTATNDIGDNCGTDEGVTHTVQITHAVSSTPPAAPMNGKTQTTAAVAAVHIDPKAHRSSVAPPMDKTKTPAGAPKTDKRPPSAWAKPIHIPPPASVQSTTAGDTMEGGAPSKGKEDRAAGGGAGRGSRGGTGLKETVAIPVLSHDDEDDDLEVRKTTYYIYVLQV